MMETWQCSTCRSSNGSNEHTCSSCGVGDPRQSVPVRTSAGAQQTGSDVASWTCRACETLNNGTMATCSACNGPESPSSQSLVSNFGQDGSGASPVMVAGAHGIADKPAEEGSLVALAPESSNRMIIGVLAGALAMLAIVAVILTIILVRRGPTTTQASGVTTRSAPSSTLAPTVTTAPQANVPATTVPTITLPAPTPSSTAAGNAPSPTQGGALSQPSASGWIAVLASIPQSGGLASAETEATGLQNTNSGVQLLDSNQYSNLRPGYYVAFLGPWQTSSEATTACVATGRAIPAACYPRSLG